MNLAYRLDSLTKSLARLETHPQAESENEVRRLVALLRASSEFRDMEPLLKAARTAEQAPSETFIATLRNLVNEIQQEIEKAPLNNGIVLIVSSDKIFTASLSENLQTQQHQTLIADSLRKAIELLTTSPISFCIVDTALTDMDGRAFIAELRTRPGTAALPVVAITPNTSKNNHNHSYSIPGADGTFQKNTAIEEIVPYLALRLKRNYTQGLQSRRDSVTGLPNRAGCHEIFQQLQQSIRENDPLAFVLIGIYQFATITHNCTPIACNDLIRKIGALLSSALRETDVTARWNESEFAILLTGEDHFGATKAIEKILPLFSDLSIKNPSGKNLPLIICAGITINNSRTTIDDAALRAESHLYMAYSDADSPLGGQRIVSDAAPIAHHEEPIALCLTNEGMAKVIKHILERETFRVEVFTDTEAVFQALTQKRFSLLILDDELPGESGFHLMQRLNEQPIENVQGTMMMVSREKSIENAMKLGARDYFLKPPSMPEFLSQIRRVINLNNIHQTTAKFTVMVADHDLPQLLMAGTTLHQLGACQILLAKGAADALQRLQSLHPEYVILAPPMPPLSIEEFINRIGTMDWLRNTKLILSTLNPSESLPSPGGTPILGAITRPFKPAILISELQKIIPSLPKTHKGLIPVDPSLLENEIQRILALNT